jgi:hypothetical protein
MGLLAGKDCRANGRYQSLSNAPNSEMAERYRSSIGPGFDAELFDLRAANAALLRRRPRDPPVITLRLDRFSHLQRMTQALVFNDRALIDLCQLRQLQPFARTPWLELAVGYVLNDLEPACPARASSS